MSIQSPDQGGQPQPTAPGKPSSRQPPQSNTGEQNAPDEGQELPKTGRDSSEPIDQDLSGDDPSDDDAAEDDADVDDADEDDADEDDADEDELGNIDLPGEGGERKELDVSRSAGNP